MNDATHGDGRQNPFVHREPLKGGGREVFLARVRKGLGHDGGASPAPREAPPVRDETLVRQVANDDAGRVDRWLAKAKANTMQVRRVASAIEAGEAVAAILRNFGKEGKGVRRVLLNVGNRLEERLGIGRKLAEAGAEVVRWGEVGCAEAAFDCDAAVTDCRAGLADAGSILVWSDTGFGRTTTLVVPLHVILLPASRVLGDMVDGLEMVMRETATAGMPSNVVIINGPSKTADIEMNLVTGVHGPKFLHVILIENL